MPKLLTLALFLLFAFHGFTQREHIQLDFDKYSCRAGDTAWFKAYIFKGQYPSSVSTNLYVALYTKDGGLLDRFTFPVWNGQSMGQVIFPDSLPTDNYYIVALTRQQLNYDTANFFSCPIFIYNKDKPQLVNHKRLMTGSHSIIVGSIKGITWITDIYPGKLSSMLFTDSSGSKGKLSLVMPLENDSILRADMNLHDSLKEGYAQFPLDTTREETALLLYEDSVLIGRQTIRLKDGHQDVALTTDTLDASPLGYNSWKLKFPDSTNYFTSISVVDADRSIPDPMTIDRLHDSHTDNFTIPDRSADTSYISFSGNASKENYLFGSKKIKDPFYRDIVMTGVRDSNFLFIKTVHIDPQGNFVLDSLFFFDTLSLQFQINKPEDGTTKNIKLRLAKFIPPTVDASCFSDWVDDTKPIAREDTFITKSELTAYELSRVKTLTPVIVKGWRSHRNELDNKYTTGPFSEPAMYSYDLRTYDNPYVHDIFSFLSRECPRLIYDPVKRTFSDPFDHPIHYFVDEMEYDSESVQMFDFDRIAYIKVLESDFTLTQRPSFTLTGGGGLKTPVQQTAINILIYLRKGTDFRTMRGGLNRMPIKGYTRILHFKSDKVTLFWDPLGAGNTYRIRFNNNQTAKRFRVKVEGMSYSGKTIHYETIIE